MAQIIHIICCLVYKWVVFLHCWRSIGIYGKNRNLGASVLYWKAHFSWTHSIVYFLIVYIRSCFVDSLWPVKMRPLKHMAIALQSGFVCMRVGLRVMVMNSGQWLQWSEICRVGARLLNWLLTPQPLGYSLCVFRAQPFNKNEPALMLLVQLSFILKG